MTDIWTHAVLNNKWGMLRISTQFMAQPDQLIVTAGFTPRSQIRSFCLVQLGRRRTGTEERKGSLLWKEASLNITSDPLLLLDIPEEEEITFLRRIKSLRSYQGELLGPSRSPGSTKDAGRMLYALKLEEEGAHFSGFKILHLKLELKLQNLMIGDARTFTNDAAILVKITSAETLSEVEELCEDVVLVNPKLAMVTSMAAATVWQRKINDIFDSPQASIPAPLVESVSLRASQGGDLLATIGNLKENIPAKKENKDNILELAKSKAILKLEGEMIGAHLPQLDSIMNHIQDKAGEPLEKMTGIKLGTQQWTPILDHRHGWQGEVAVQLRGKANLENFYSKTNGLCINTTYGILHLSIVPHWAVAAELREARALYEVR